MIGEFDGSGCIRACGVALALYHGRIPPMIGTEHLDPECDLNVGLHYPIKREVRSVLLNACSNGGSNLSILFKRYVSS